MKLGVNQCAHLSDRTDERGFNHVAIELLTQPADRRPFQMFQTDLDRLEPVLKRAEEYRQRDGTEPASLRPEKIGDYEVTFLPWPTRGKAEHVDINLQHVTEHAMQVFALKSEGLKEVVQEARKVEDALGYTQRYYALVHADSMKRDESGRIFAKVASSVPDRTDAETREHKSSGLALWPEPFRRPPPEGKTIEVTKGVSTRIDNDIELCAKIAERRGEFYVIAAWADVDNSPHSKPRVTIDPTFTEYNDKVHEMRAFPEGGKVKLGKPGVPLYVLVRMDEDSAFHGKVEEVSHHLNWITEAFMKGERFLKEERTREQKSQEYDRMMITDWNKHSF